MHLWRPCEYTEDIHHITVSPGQSLSFVLVSDLFCCFFFLATKLSNFFLYLSISFCSLQNNVKVQFLVCSDSYDRVLWC